MGDRVAVMRGGLLQQVAAPQVLYERPHNLFVAEFIGSPAMNVVMAELVRENGDLSVRFGPHRLRTSEATLERHPGLGRYEGRAVILGIRPEDFADASLREGSADHELSVVCDIREDMGSDVYAHFDVAAEAVTSKELEEAALDSPADEEARLAAERARALGVPFVARLDRATRAREGETLTLAVDVGRLHFFDPETGLGIYEAP
jgi:multiple sugar transport system ATP-binding protein